MTVVQNMRPIANMYPTCPSSHNSIQKPINSVIIRNPPITLVPTKQSWIKRLTQTPGQPAHTTRSDSEAVTLTETRTRKVIRIVFANRITF